MQRSSSSTLGPVKWYFTKYVVGRDGKVVRCFGPDATFDPADTMDLLIGTRGILIRQERAFRAVWIPRIRPQIRKIKYLEAAVMVFPVNFFEAGVLWGEKIVRGSVHHKHDLPSEIGGPDDLPVPRDKLEIIKGRVHFFPLVHNIPVAEIARLIPRRQSAAVFPVTFFSVGAERVNVEFTMFAWEDVMKFVAPRVTRKRRFEVGAIPFFGVVDIFQQSL